MLMQSVCQAVQHAHERGIIHRDLKPSNILVDGRGQPKVLDFGLAKLLRGELPRGEGQAALSVDGEVAGTPIYMSPEQAAGRLDSLDTRSDVYTLGVILFRLLTGQYPHDAAGSYLDVMRRIAEREPMRLSAIQPRADRELEALLLKALAKEPERRYQSAGDMGDDLGRYLAGDPLVARPPTASYFLRRKFRKHRLPLALAGMVILALAGMAVWSYVRVTRARDVAIAAKNSEQIQRAQAVAQRNQANRLQALAEHNALLARENARQAQQNAQAALESETRALAGERDARLQLARAIVSQADAMANQNEWDLARAGYARRAAC